MVEYVEYVLVEWREDDKSPESVPFKSDFKESFNLNRLTDRVIMTLLDILGKAKLTNPDGFYLLIPSPNKHGAEIRVQIDGFRKLRSVFPGIVSGLVNEYKGRRR